MAGGGDSQLDPSRAAVDDAREELRRSRTSWRRQQIIDAATRLMERDGYHGVSVQAIATEAGMSAGLIYQYVASKQELLLEVVLDILREYEERVPAAVAGDDDPVERLAAGFRTYCEVIDDRHLGAVLTYRETGTLDRASRRQVQAVELRTLAPLTDAVRDGVEQGIFVVADPELVAYDLVMLAHTWALKSWWLAGRMSLQTYVERQFELVLGGILTPRARRRYAHHLRG